MTLLSPLLSYGAQGIPQHTSGNCGFFTIWLLQDRRYSWEDRLINRATVVPCYVTVDNVQARWRWTASSGSWLPRAARFAVGQCEHRIR